MPSELARSGFVWMDFGSADEPGAAAVTLRVGTLDGHTTARIDAGQVSESAEHISAWASASRSGAVLWGNGTEVHLVAIDTGEDRLVLDAPRPGSHGVLNPDGATAYVAFEEGEGRWSVWAFAVDGSSEPEQLRAALPTRLAGRNGTGIVRARTSSPVAYVAISPDGRTLALQECEGPCRVWTLDLATAEAHQYPPVDFMPVPMQAVLGSTVIGGGALLELRSGAAADAAFAVALARDGTARVASGTSLVDQRGRPVWAIPVDPIRDVHAVSPPPWFDVELPAGWVLAVERLPDQCDECGGYVALNIETGELVPLPVLGGL